LVTYPAPYMESQPKLPFVGPDVLVHFISKFPLDLRKAKTLEDLHRLKGNQEVLDHLRGLVDRQDQRKGVTTIKK